MQFCIAYAAVPNCILWPNCLQTYHACAFIVQLLSLAFAIDWATIRNEARLSGTACHDDGDAGDDDDDLILTLCSANDVGHGPLVRLPANAGVDGLSCTATCPSPPVLLLN